MVVNPAFSTNHKSRLHIPSLREQEGRREEEGEVLLPVRGARDVRRLEALREGMDWAASIPSTSRLRRIDSRAHEASIPSTSRLRRLDSQEHEGFKCHVSNSKGYYIIRRRLRRIELLAMTFKPSSCALECQYTRPQTDSGMAQSSSAGPYRG